MAWTVGEERAIAKKMRTIAALGSIFFSSSLGVKSSEYRGAERTGGNEGSQSG